VTSARFVLDTNVVVQLLRGNEVGKRIEARFGLLAAPIPPLLSAVSLGEARSLARQWSWGPEKSRCSTRSCSSS
jgi:hypothetical protein